MDSGQIAMYLGMTEYFAGNYELALIRFAEVGTGNLVVREVLHQASWYEANAFLGLNRPTEARIALERLLSSERGFPYDEQAAATYDDLCNALGINSSVTKH